MSATAIDLSVSSPVGELRYRPAPPSADVDARGLRLQWQPSEFGCLEAAVATMLGVDFAEVPHGPIGDHTKAQELEARGRLDAWLAGRGYRMRRGPITREVLDRLWIGVSVDPRPGWDHTVVCSGRSIVHDPALRFGLQFSAMGLGIEPVKRLDEAITIDRLEER